jgi:tetratricopeptide (TPR) repeat protein
VSAILLQRRAEKKNAASKQELKMNTFSFWSEMSLSSQKRRFERMNGFRIARWPTARPKSGLRALTSVVLTLSLFILCSCSAGYKKTRALERADRDFKAGDFDKARIEYLTVLKLDRINRTAIKQLGIIYFEDGAPVRAFPFLRATRDLDPSNLQNRTKLASVILMLGDSEQARKEALAVLQQSPGEGEALFVLADSSRTEEAIQETEQHLQQAPESAALHMARATLALRRNDMPGAESELQRALAVEPKSVLAHMSMANFLAARKETARAGQEFKIASDLAPARSLARVKYAEFQAANGALSEARASLKETSRLAPDFLPAWLLSAQFSLNEKKYDEAIAFLDNVFSRDPDNIEARLLEAQARLAKGETKKGVEVLAALDKAYPNSPLIEFQLARAYLQDNNLTEGTTELKKVLETRPDYFDARLLLAQLYLGSGNFQEVISVIGDLAKKRPDLTAAQTLLAEAYRSLGRLDEATALVREKIRLSPQDPQGYFLLGIILRQQNKNEEARRAFQKVLDISPDNLLPIDQLVDVDISEKKFESAMQRVQAQLQKTPKTAALHFIEAKIYVAQSAWDRAEADLSKALELDPNYTSAYELMISVYMAADKLPQAVTELQTYLSKHPDDPRALMTLGAIYEKQKEVAKARETYEKLLAKTPGFVPALNNLAYLYAEALNEPEKAYDLARKARELQPSDPNIADTLGWTLYKKGDYQAALALFQESAGKLEQSSDARFHLAMASYMMGDTEKARAAFEEALQGTADFAGKDEAQRRLALLGDGKATSLSTEQLEAMLKQQPNDPLARLRLAESYQKEKAFPKAAEQYEYALKINPKLLSTLIALAQLNAGPLQNNEKALDFAKRARELAPTDAKVAGILGAIAYQASSFTWAYSLLQESARQLGDNPTVLHDYAWATYSLGNVTDARDIMQRAVNGTPAPDVSEDANSFLTMTALDQNPKEAIAAEPQVQKLLQADPRYVPALMARASIELQRGDSKHAIGTYGEVLQRFPDFAPAQKHLAAVYLKDPSGLDKAYELAVKARKTLPNDAELSRVLGEISCQRKEYPRAVQLLQESARTIPLNGEGLYYLGTSQLQTKQKAQGTESLEQALKAGLQEPLASEAKRLLAEAKDK